MTYWIADDTEKDGYAFDKYTAEDEKKNPDHKAGSYVLDADGNKIRSIREKQFGDINWNVCVAGKFFNVATTDGETADDHRRNLVQAISVVLYPLNDILNFVLNSGTLDIAGVANLTGADGYENAIYPLLQVLGCSEQRNGLVTPEQYKKDVETSKYNLIYDILNPLFSRLNNILLGMNEDVSAVGPVRAILNVLPNFALFIEQGGIQKLVEELIYPVGNLLDTVLGVLSKDRTTLFNVAFDAFVTPEALKVLHKAADFEGTGITDRIIEKLIVAVFNPADKAETDIQWNNAHKHIFEIVAGFVNAIDVNKDGNLEIGGIVLKIAEKKDETGAVITPAKEFELPAVIIPSVNDLLSDLSKIGAPIPWSNVVEGTDKWDGQSAVATQRRTDTFVTLWNYIWSIVEVNNNGANSFLQQLVNGYLKELLGDDTFNLVSPYIFTVLGRTSNDVLSAFIQVTKALDTSDVKVQDKWDAYFAKEATAKPVTYPVKNYAEVTDNNKDELYTEKEVTKAVNAISGIAQSVLTAATGNTLTDLSVDLLYNDNLIATISQAICSIADNNIAQAFLPLLDIDLSIDGISAKLKEYGYVEIAAAVDALKSTDPTIPNGKFSDLKWFVEKTDDKGNVVKDEKTGEPVMIPSELAEKWYVTDAQGFIDNVWNKGSYQNPNISAAADIDAQYRFTRAIVVAVSQFSNIINTLFNARTSTIFGEIELTGSYGYRNAIKPLLQALNADPMSVADFNTYIDGGKLSNGTTVKANQDYVIYNILNPILSKVDDIIKNPGQQLFATIATFGSFLGGEAFTGKGNLQSAVEYLLTPLLSMVDPIVRLATDNDDLFTIVFNILGIYHHDENGKNKELVTWNNIHKHLFDVVAHFLGYNEEDPNAVYTETLDKTLVVKNITINDKKYTLRVPEYDLSKLASCTVSSALDKMASDAFVTVFRYIRSIINENSVQKNSKGEYVTDTDTGMFVLDDVNAFIPVLVKDLINNEDTWATVKPYLQNVLGSKNDEILVTVIRLFENLDTSVLPETVEEITKAWDEKLALSSDKANVDYNGLVMDEITTAIDTLRTSVHNALDAYTEIDLANFTVEHLYKGNIPQMLAGIIFPLSDNALIAAILNIFHINVSREFIVQQLEKYGYDEMAAVIKAVPADKKLADEIAWKVQGTDEATGKPAVDKDGKPVMVINPDLAKLWYVEDEDEFRTHVWANSDYKNPEVEASRQALNAQYRFTRAIVIVLSPIRELIGVLTQAKSMTIYDDANNDAYDVVLKGEYGYSNAIKPLLEALGLDAMDGKTYREMAEINPDYILYNIINPILLRVDEMLDKPIRSVLDTLPKLAQYIGNGGLQESITNLLYPITKIASPIVRLVLGEVRSETEVSAYRFYDLIIGVVAEIFDIEPLKLTDEQREEGFSIWANIHKWDYLKSLVDGILSWLNVKTPVVMIDDKNQVVTTDGHYVKVTAVTDKDADGKEIITGYVYKYTVKVDGKDVEKTIKLAVKDVTKILGVEINGIVYPITIPEEGPFDRLANCQNFEDKAGLVKAVTDAQAALDALEPTATDEEKQAAEEALADAKAAAVDAEINEVRGNTLLVFIQYVWYVVEQNEPEFITPLLKNLLGNYYNTFEEYIEKVIGEKGATPADISTALVKVLNAIDSHDYDVSAEWAELLDKITATDVEYPADGSYTRDDVKTAIETLSNILKGVLENVLNTSITELTTEKIYTNAIVNTLAKAIYTAVAGMESTLKLVGIDVSQANVAKLLKDAGYTDIANAIAGLPNDPNGKTWANESSWGYDWKVNNNSKDFAHAIAAVLKPFDTLISALLCAGEVDIASVITITGANGYKNALQPLLKEIGFDTTITEADGTLVLDENAPTLEGIIRVVLNKFDEIVADENLVGKVIDILPGLANFVANGGVQKFIESLLYPVLHLIDPILKLVTDKNIFNFAIEILAKLDVIDLTDYDWNDVHEKLFTIVETFITVDYTVVG